MKAKIKATGEVVEVEQLTRTTAVCLANGKIYNKQQLDINIDSPQPTATIEGWVARDGDNLLYFYYTPCRARGKSSHWTSMAVGSPFQLPSNIFPDLTWQDEPIEVEITIKPKER